MKRKVFISFLGTNNYGLSHYHRGSFRSEEVRYVQEATLQYLHQKEAWTSDDFAYILLTKMAEQRNWVDNGHTDRGTNEIIKAPGLDSLLRQMGIPVQIEPIRNLPDGNTEEEIWAIFTRIFEKIQDGDRLYFDLTHGYRYLPMLVLVLGNYAKFLRKDITIEHISYGNYEGRDRVTNDSLIVDLLPLTMLQDWTYAAGQYVESGDASRLTKLSNQAVRPLMKKAAGGDPNVTKLYHFIKELDAVTNELRLCRGVSIIEANSMKHLRDARADMNASVIPPLSPILEHVQESLSDFDGEENVRNAFVAAKWCASHKLYQQAATVLQEFIVTYFCEQYGIDWHTEQGRNPVSKAFATQDKPEETWILGLGDAASEEEKDALRGIIRNVHDAPKFNDFSKVYKELTELRNDLNHSGMRHNPRKPKDVGSEIDELIDKVSKILQYGK